MNLVPTSVLVPQNGCPPIIGNSDALRRLVTLAHDLARSDLPVLIIGATGTGKELLAQHVHHWSGRRGPLVDVNCAGLPRELVDGWLFGHRKNAFTGAGDAAPGLIEEAAHGTLFLDEVCSLPMEVQAKLLRVLETKEVRRVMDTGKRLVPFRLVAAAQDGLGEAVEAGGFRRDLYHRLAGAVLRVPALAERLQDLVPLATYFAATDGRVLGVGVDAVLTGYSWPGNVRELAVVVRRAALLRPRGVIRPKDVAEAIALGAPGTTPVSRIKSPKDPVAARTEIVAALATCNWEVGRAAQCLGVHRVTLFRWARRLGVSLRRGPR